MVSNKKSVLPNFAKTLLIAAFALGANLTLAGEPGDAEEKIMDLKDMTPTELEVEQLTEDPRDQVEQAAEDAVDGATSEIDKAVEEAEQAITPQR